MSYAYYRFFTGDYMRDTMHLGWYQDLAYRRLIDLYLLHGKPIRNDRSYILRAIRAFEPEQQTAADEVLAEFFELKPDGWHQRRCDAELRWRKTMSDAGKAAVEAREKGRRNRQLQSTDHLPIIDERSNQNQNQNQITPKSKPSFASYDARFIEFWSVYPRKKSKYAAFKAWKKISPTQELHDVILAAVSKAKSSHDWKKEGGEFIPHPATWLNAHGWEDELIDRKRLFPV